MTHLPVTESFPEPPIREDLILRYAAQPREDESALQLLRDSLAELREKLSYRVCYRRLSLRSEKELCYFDGSPLYSRQLALLFSNCSEAVLFAATVGFAPDRLIAKYARLSPAKALMLQAIGTERVEALCDAFCLEFSRRIEGRVTARFSPGYGDLPLEAQREVFSLLNGAAGTGICLNRSLLMSPTKSVTAFFGIL